MINKIFKYFNNLINFERDTYILREHTFSNFKRHGYFTSLDAAKKYAEDCVWDRYCSVETKYYNMHRIISSQLAEEALDALNYELGDSFTIEKWETNTYCGTWTLFINFGEENKLIYMNELKWTQKDEI